MKVIWTQNQIDNYQAFEGKFMLEVKKHGVGLWWWLCLYEPPGTEAYELVTEGYEPRKGMAKRAAEKAMMRHQQENIQAQNVAI